MDSLQYTVQFSPAALGFLRAAVRIEPVLHQYVLSHQARPVPRHPPGSDLYAEPARAGRPILRRPNRAGRPMGGRAFERPENAAALRQII